LQCPQRISHILHGGDHGAAVAPRRRIVSVLRPFEQV
jgi:hypothetical protein